MGALGRADALSAELRLDEKAPHLLAVVTGLQRAPGLWARSERPDGLGTQTVDSRTSERGEACAVSKRLVRWLWLPSSEGIITVISLSS